MPDRLQEEISGIYFGSRSKGLNSMKPGTCVFKDPETGPICRVLLSASAGRIGLTVFTINISQPTYGKKY
jgi:hypothetical protein